MREASPRSPKLKEDEGHELHVPLWQKALKLLACTFMVYACYMGYSFIQERLYTIDWSTLENIGRDTPSEGRFKFPVFMNGLQTLGNMLIAFLFLKMNKSSARVKFYPLKQWWRPTPLEHKLSMAMDACRSLEESTIRQQMMEEPVPAHRYLVIGFSYVYAMSCSGAALRFINYPTQVLVKCCKILPVMLMRSVINRTKYSTREYVNFMVVTVGICTFFLGKPGSKNSASAAEVAASAGVWDYLGLDESSFWYLIGVMLCVCSLVLDGFLGPNQEYLNSSYAPSVSQMMFALNAAALVSVLPTVLYAGTLVAGVQFVLTHYKILFEMCIYVGLSAAGQYVILYTVQSFDSLTLTTITTTRKFFTILFSVVWFMHPVSSVQWFGVVLVFCGLGLQIKYKVDKQRKKGTGKGLKINVRNVAERQQLLTPVGVAVDNR